MNLWRPLPLELQKTSVHKGRLLGLVKGTFKKGTSLFGHPIHYTLPLLVNYKSKKMRKTVSFYTVLVYIPVY